MRLSDLQAKPSRPLVDEILPSNWKDFSGIFCQLSRDARKRHRSIEGIHIEDAAFPRASRQTLDALGYQDCEHIQLESASPDRGGISDGDGGEFIVVRKPNNKIKTVVVVRKRMNIDPRMADALCIPVLCHELGHVDDFEKRINLVVGQVLMRGRLSFMHIATLATR